VLVPRVGYCEYNCNLCGQVCPTEAIEPLPIEEKKKLRLGLATLDRSRCLPYAYDRECMVCEEHCPVSPKAIFFLSQEVQTRNGKTAVLKQPRVDPDRCTGCGICENVCVFKDRAAIRVTSANETRHSGNRAILTGPTDLEPEPAGPGPPAEPNPYAQPSPNPYGSS
jgi:Pyruvate/2-oxoacid:ferredoxin oxidoreductase delta subunit